jgi:poly-gamma-glutamate synthesis protein (capsule biosynthesis protein)
VAILAACFPDSGVPHLWEAEEGRSGIFFLREPGEQAAESVVDALQEVPERVPRILSVHWGSNWGYEVSEKHRRFARALIESDTVDLLFGHSSHHPKEVEVYRERVIIYGAGDLINDYEGIRGHREYRPDLGLLYTVALRRGAVLRLEATPLRRRRFRLEGASAEDARFLSGVLSKDGRVSEVTIGDAGRLQINLGPR